MSRIAILGAGAWGTALAINLANRGGHGDSGSHSVGGSHQVTLWSRSSQAATEVRERHENAHYLPGFALPQTITITADANRAIDEAEIVVSVVPSEHLRSTYEQFAPLLRRDQVIVSATKGIEDQTLLRMSELIQETLAQGNLDLSVGVLSGPSFAQEVAAGSPTALTIASTDSALAVRIQREFSGATLRLYTNDDVVGVELGGALKNVIAIASGVVTGLGLGHNTAAALITRGIAEITRLAVACGGRQETLSGLSGIGDLVLTCTGALSRNRLVGIELGKGRQLQDILEGLHGKVAEGVRTTFAAYSLAKKHEIEMPITEQMAAILSAQRKPVDAMRELMARPGRDE
jgi:glycerol-3-phosphate dehydrogenase (NAD(P)+)